MARAAQALPNTFTIHLQKNAASTVPQAIIKATGETSPTSADYVAGPFTRNKDHLKQFYLHVKETGKGLTVQLEVMPEDQNDPPETDDYTSLKSLGGLTYKRSRGEISVALIGADGNTTGEAVTFVNGADRSAIPRAVHQSGQPALLPDLMPIVDLLTQQYDSQIESQKSTIWEGVDHNDISLFLKSSLVPAAARDKMGVFDSNTLTLTLPAKRLAQTLELPIEKEVTGQPATWQKASQLLPMFTRSDIPGLGTLSKPFFIQGPGSIVIKNGNHSQQGDLYFIQILQIDDNGIDIKLRRLNRNSVHESCYAPTEAHDAVTLQLRGEQATLIDGAGTVLPSAIVRSWPLNTNQQTIPGLISQMDKIKIINLMSRWKNQLHQTDSEAQISTLATEDINKLFPTTPPGKPENTRAKAGIIIDTAPLNHKVSIGFARTAGRDNINTRMLAHPANPAAGISIGPLLLQSSPDEKEPYGFSPEEYITQQLYHGYVQARRQ